MRKLIVPFALSLLSACAAGSAAPPPAEVAHAETMTSTTIPMAHRHGDRARSFDLPRRLVDGKKGEVLDAEKVFSDLLTARVIYVSESHPNPHHHAMQLAVIAGLWARDHSVAIGLEMIKRPFQAVLDEYLDGKIDADEMCLRVEWEDRWGYSFELYRGVFEFARAHHIHLYALNAPDEITDAVAVKGVEGLSPEQRESLPDLDLTNEEDREEIKEIFSAHHHASLGKFDDFYAAQVIWDETMAYEISRVLSEAEPPHHVVVLAGAGHIRQGGIPMRAARRGAQPYRTIVPIMLDDLAEAVEDETGDYLWVMASKEEDFSI